MTDWRDFARLVGEDRVRRLVDGRHVVIVGLAMLIVARVIVWATEHPRR